MDKQHPLTSIVKPIAKLSGLISGTIGGVITGDDPKQAAMETAEAMGEIVDVVLDNKSSNK